MPVNPYFNEVTFVTEQDLIDSLIVESIQIHGHSAYYLTREDVDVDALFGEDPLARYPDAHEIEVYISDAFITGQQDFINKFGLTIEDRATFLVAVTRFHQEFPTLRRPRENDIIYIQMTPNNRYLFEIKFVDDKEQIFQLGKLYTWKLSCELMVYSHERVTTAMPEVNTVAEQEAFTQELTFTSGAGAFVVGEVVYQGTSFLTATASGTVSTWNAITKLLGVQNISGAFGAYQTFGVDSGASYLPVESPTLTPTVHEQIADNELIINEVESIIVNRGNNPRFN